MKYRKKPVIVEAEQFKGFYYGPYPKGVHVDQEAGPRCYVVTIHGQKAYLDDDDWVITEPDGIHHYPCKPDIFAATYEPVEDTDKPIISRLEPYTPWHDSDGLSVTLLAAALEDGVGEVWAVFVDSEGNVRCRTQAQFLQTFRREYQHR